MLLLLLLLPDMLCGHACYCRSRHWHGCSKGIHCQCQPSPERCPLAGAKAQQRRQCKDMALHN